MNLSKELTERGFINQFSSENLEDIIDGEKRTVYHGIDPSADSAQAGNMVIWMMLKHLANNGHKIIFLIGGATGMIGDPKPNTERELKDKVVVEDNVVKIKKQAEDFFSDHEVEFVNNLDWLENMSLLEFLREVGKHYTINELVKKDAIATRLQSDTGLSYTEFAYPLLQGYDYYQLFKDKNCTVQIGGSDQWGNIVSGVELVRRKEQTEVFAITAPLVVDKTTGKKFGKSEGNSVWLDKEKTSPYEFYQFWLNVSDENVFDYLKLFTFISLDEVKKIEEKTKDNPGAREAQKTLAQAVTTIVHGEEEVEKVMRINEVFFGKLSFSSLTQDEISVVKKNAPYTPSQNEAQLVDVLVESGLASSKREAKTFIETGAVQISGNKTIDTNLKLSEAEHGKYLFLKRGKKKMSLIEII